MGGAVNRIASLLGLLEDNPQDSFCRYALALEYVRAGRTDDARREFETVLVSDPSYLATYLQLGQLYRTMNILHEAEKTFRSGIGVAVKARDAHTQGELEGALDSLLNG